MPESLLPYIFRWEQVASVVGPWDVTLIHPCGRPFGAQTPATSTNNIALTPFYAAGGRRVIRLGSIIATLDAAGLFRAGIYESGPDFYPASLLLDSGDLATTPGTFVSAAVNFRFPRDGWYWGAVNSNSAIAAFRASAQTDSVFLGFTTTGGQASGLTLASAFGAFPDPLPAGALLKFAGAHPWAGYHSDTVP